MPRKIISVGATGDLTFLNDPAFHGLVAQGQASIRRASHIEPVGRPERWAFHFLRKLFGETGRVAAWTRNWKCPWRVNLAPSDGPVLGPFLSRPTAIDAEIEWLQTHNLGTRNKKVEVEYVH